MHRTVSIGKGTSVFVSALVWLLGVVPLLAQTDRGTITGTVTDPSGAVIVGATVSATNVATSISTRTTTTSAGIYVIPLLRGGTYEVSIEQSGFKRYVEANVILEVGQTVRVDGTLQLGQPTETINVTALAGQVQRDTSDRGTIITGKDVLDLPIVGQGEQRNPGFFMILAPGVTGRGTSGGGTSRMMSTTVNGSQSASNEFAVDGALIGSTSEWAGDFRNIPFPQDVVGEYKVMTLNPPAEVGRTGQGYTSFTLKTGSNQFHGSAYEYFRNEKLDARGFFRPSPPINKQNEYGGTIGGPIRKDKTFFFGWYQGFRLRRAASNSLDTVPTSAMKNGDLSNILGPQMSLNGCSGVAKPAAPAADTRTAAPCFDMLNRPVYAGQIYDPLTERAVAPGVADPITGTVTSTLNPDGTQHVGNWIIRDGFGFNPTTGLPIAGSANIIPANRIDPVASSMFSHFPSPSLPGQKFGYQSNWLTAFKNQNAIHSWGGKIDHTITDNHRISGSFLGSRANNPVGGRYPDPIGEGGINKTYQYVGRLSHDWIMRPNLVNHMTAGYNRWAGDSFPESGLDWPAALGWSGVPQTGPGSVWPGLNIGGLGNTYGNAGQGSNASNTFTFDESLTWTKGRHTIKGGFAYVKMQENDNSFGLQSGYLNFSNGTTSLPGGVPGDDWYNDGGTTGSVPGMGMAGFLLGLGSQGRAFVYAATNADRMGQYAGYLQDDYKVSSKLTLKLGIRYDILLPTVSAHNQMSWMDPTVTNTNFGIPGAMVFATDGTRSGAETYKRAFGPRFGFAYAINDKTAIRGGYGILYTLGGANRSSRGCCYQQGFNSDNNLAPTSVSGNTGLHPVFSFANGSQYNAAFVSTDPTFIPLTNGWPSGRFPAPPFIDQNYALGGAPQIIAPGAGRPPDIQNWNLSIQRQMPGQILVDVGYVGTKGTHLVSRLGTSNYADPAYLSYGANLFKDISDPGVQALPQVAAWPVDPATTHHVPFVGFQGIAGIPKTLGQALRPFPQYTQLPNFQMRDMMETIGVSSYHALQVQARKHFSQGLSFLVSYTWSKTLTDAESIFNEFSGFTQDPYNRKAEKSLSLNDYPNNIVISYQYELPFGPGKKFANSGGAAGKVIGGWSIAGIQQYQSGPPILFTMGSNPLTPYYGPNGFLARPNVVPGVTKRNGSYDKAYVGDPTGAITHLDGSACSTAYPCNYANSVDRAAVWNGNAWVDAPSYTLGTAPRSDGGARRFGYLNEDISIIKRTAITERVNIEFRADFLNMFNRTVFGNDSGGDQYDSILEGTAIDWGVGSFGRIRSQGNYARQIQFGLKVVF